MRTGASPDGQDPGRVLMRPIYQWEFKRCNSPLLRARVGGPSIEGEKKLRMMT